MACFYRTVSPCLFSVLLRCSSCDVRLFRGAGASSVPCSPSANNVCRSHGNLTPVSPSNWTISTRLHSLHHPVLFFNPSRQISAIRCLATTSSTRIRFTSTVSENESKEKLPEKLSIFQRFKRMYKEYWYVLLPVHLVTSSVWFALFYYASKRSIFYFLFCWWTISILVAWYIIFVLFSLIHIVLIWAYHN